MQALSREMVMLEGYCSPLPVALELRLARLRVPPAWRPAMMTTLRLAMGTGLGVVLGAAAGHAAFWTPVGTCLGLVLGALARRS